MVPLYKERVRNRDEAKDSLGPYLVIGATSIDGVILRTGVRHLGGKCEKRCVLYSSVGEERRQLRL